MTITELKSRLSILTVLDHYGLKPNRNNMIRCPWHDDKKASMRVYVETNTVYCFAGGCSVSSLDGIDFVMRMDGCSKHEAIMKCKGLVENTPLPVPEKSVTKVEAPTKVSTAAKDFVRYRRAFITHQAAQAYREERGLSAEHLEIGYKSRKTRTKWARGCIIFPLKNEAGEVVSLYGRSIYGPGHYYQQNRSGLYPGYPAADTKVLLLTESIIDAASLIPLDLDCSLLAMYGTNGLTAEHRRAIQNLPDLEEIVFGLDGDLAGKKATRELYRELRESWPKLKYAHLRLGQGRDLNDLVRDPGQAGYLNAAGLIRDIFLRRDRLVRTTAELKEAGLNRGAEEIESNVTPQLIERDVLSVPRENQGVERSRDTQLDTSNPHNLTLQTELATYAIKGGLRYADKDLDSLKVTLQVASREAGGHRSRRRVNLYEDKEVVAASRAIGERLGLRADLLEQELYALTDALEVYREELRKAKPKTEHKVQVSQSLRTDCLAFLKRKQLLKNINDLIGKSGLTGEENNRLLLFIVASSYQMPTTLHALIQGASGSGKTQLLKVISELMPPESVKRYTRVTDGSFYNQDEHFFSHKLLCFEDIDGLKEDALLAVRELQSNEILITSTSFKDESGSIRGGERIVRGPIASISCTTKAEVYEDNISRCFVVAVDESREQSLRVIEYQNQKSAGLITKADEQQTRIFLQNCMRLLQPLEVVNPYANKIQLPQEAHKIRRLNELYQSFVRQITLLHQYQRKRDKQGRLITEVSDLKAACDILFESILLKVDELDGSLRQFFEQLKTYVHQRGRQYEFNRFEVRQATGVSKTQQHRYMSQLLELEYLRQYGYANRGYRYKIAHWDDVSRLRQHLKTHLGSQLSALNV